MMAKKPLTFWDLGAILERRKRDKEEIKNNESLL
jgi:hypothetical protein